MKDNYYIDPLNPIDPVEDKKRVAEAKLILCIDKETKKVIYSFIGSSNLDAEVKEVLNINNVSNSTIRTTCNNNKKRGELKHTLYNYYWIYADDIKILNDTAEIKRAKKLIFNMAVDIIKDDPNVNDNVLVVFNNSLKLQTRSLSLIRYIVKNDIEKVVSIACLMGGFEEGYICNCCNLDYRQYIKDKYNNTLPEAVKTNIYKFMIDYLIPDFYKSELTDLL